MDRRQLRALEIAASTKLEPDGGRWAVPSQSGSGRHYVTLGNDGWQCTCEDWQERRDDCKHCLAVEFTVRRENGGTPPELGALVKVTRARDWASYNLGATREGQHFPQLLADLCALVPQPPYATGRPPLLMADMVFAIVTRSYAGQSIRRFASTIRAAQEAGWVQSVPSTTSLWRYFRNPSLTSILQELVTISSLPLKAIETDFAVDGTGFATRRMTSWYNKRLNRQVSVREWVKAHLIVGTRTHIVTGVEITGWAGGESRLLPGLVDRTAENFRVQRVSADKGYSSKANAEAIERVGAQPLIAFKANTVRPDEDTAWSRMWHLYAYRREEFLKHYHRRSNVESAIFQIKARFGDALFAKSDEGQVNELLARVVAHNICILVQSFYDLGIDPTVAEPPQRSAA